MDNRAAGVREGKTLPSGERCREATEWGEGQGPPRSAMIRHRKACDCKLFGRSSILQYAKCLAAEACQKVTKDFFDKLKGQTGLDGPVCLS